MLRRRRRLLLCCNWWKCLRDSRTLPASFHSRKRGTVSKRELPRHKKPGRQGESIACKPAQGSRSPSFRRLPKTEFSFVPASRCSTNPVPNSADGLFKRFYEQTPRQMHLRQTLALRWLSIFLLLLSSHPRPCPYSSENQKLSRTEALRNLLSPNTPRKAWFRW